MFMKNTMPMKLLLILVVTFSSNIFAKPIPVEHYAQKSQFKLMKISPDGKHLAFTYEDGSETKLGTMRLADQKPIYSFDVGPDRIVTDFWWATDQRLILIGQNNVGYLDGQYSHPELYAVDYDGKDRVHLGHGGGVRVTSMLRSDPKHIITSKYRYNQDVKLQRRNIYHNESEKDARVMTGMPKLQGSMNSTLWYVVLDNEDHIRVAVEYDKNKDDNRDDDKIYLHVKEEGGQWEKLELVVKNPDNLNFKRLGFDASGDKFYFSSNHDLANKGTTGLFEYNFKSKQTKLLFRHPDVDINHPIKSADKDIIGVYLEPGYPQYHYLKDEALEAKIKQHKSLRASFKNLDIAVGQYTDNKKLTVIRTYSDKQPNTFYLFDQTNNKVTFLANSKPQINPKEMASVEPFTLQARDGLKMYGQMTLPPGKALEKLPLVIHPHGGPYGVRDYWEWDPLPQLLANRGYLVIQLNFRGSGGYGLNFEEAGHHEWGGKMQDDLTDVTKWAINQGYADENKICIYGVSYGGYAALQGVIKEPELYQCAIAEAGTYDIPYHMKSTDSFKGDGKYKKWYLNRMFGENYEQLMIERSPTNYLDKLKANLMIVHGKKDVRVSIGNAKLLEKKLKEHNKPYETLYNKKEGHGFLEVSSKVELYQRILDFLNKNISQP